MRTPTKNSWYRLLLLVLVALLGLLPALSAIAEAAPAASPYVTRQEVVSAFVESIGRNNMASSDFMLNAFDGGEDIILTPYWDDYSKAVARGIVRSEYDNPLRATENVTRLEALIMLCCAMPAELPYDHEDAVYTDVPELEQNFLSILAQAGFMTEYPAGALGASDPITHDELKTMTDKLDSLYNEVKPSESYYGFINQKAFRNATLDTASYVDALHGAVVLSTDKWSYITDADALNQARTKELLERLMSGELAYEQGSAEQRVHDLLECIDSPDSMNEADVALLQGYYEQILSAQTVAQLVNVTNTIYAETSVPTLLSVSAGQDVETGTFYPQFGLFSTGLGGVMNYYSVAKETNGALYSKLLGRYGTDCNLSITDEDVQKAITLQEIAAVGTNYFPYYYNALTLYMSIIPDFDLAGTLAAIGAEHPEVDIETGAVQTSAATINTRKEAQAALTNVQMDELLASLGYGEMDNILFNSDEAMQQMNAALSDESYLNAFKLNALLALASTLSADYNEPSGVTRKMLSDMFLNTLMLQPASEEDFTDAIDWGTTTDSNDILCATNLNSLGALVPNDVGLIFCHGYYDEKTTEIIEKMIAEIKAAYINRFEKNEWMSDETKQNAIKKVKSIVATVGYAKNSVYPVIVSKADGGSLFNNVIRINQAKMQADILTCKDPVYQRSTLQISPDTFNAFYSPQYNSINIPAGILQWPFYDVNASYAYNLGAIGSVIAHEIGHAFDATGARFDENGCLKNWWTEEDYATFSSMQQNFRDYYNRFEIVEGVVQDTSVTITENMADFSGLQCVFDIIGDDQQVQKEVMESFAMIWAQLGTEKALTSSGILRDVHSSNSVRVNACVASLDAFYELYGITEGDPMYVAPENRLNLW